MAGFQWQAYGYPGGGTIADLMLAQGRTRADALRSSSDAAARAMVIGGQAWGNAANTIGGIVAGIPQQIQQSKAHENDAELRAQQLALGKQNIAQNDQQLAAGQAAAAKAARDAAEDKALRAVFAEGEPKPEQIYQIVGPQRGADILKGFAALKVENQKLFKSSQELIGAMTGGILALPEPTRADAYATARQSLITAGHVAPESVPEAYDPAFVQQAHIWALTPDKQEEIAHPKLIEHDPTKDVINPQTGAVVTAGTPKPPEPKPVQSEDFLLDGQRVKGTFDPYKGAYIYNGQDVTARAKPIPPASAGGGAAGASGGLDPDGVEYLATQYRILGAPGIPTRISEADRVKAINLAAKQAKQLGQSPVQAVQKQAAYKADAASLTKITAMSSAAESFETKANAQADLVSSLSTKVARTQYPALNGWLIAGKVAAGNSDAHLFGNALLTFTTEYAKIMEGSTGSAAASSDSARKAAASLISTALNKGTLAKTVTQMQWEMRQTVLGYGAVIDHITERMGGAPQTPVSGAVLRYNPATGKVE